MFGFAGVVRLDGAPVAEDAGRRWERGLAGPARVSMCMAPSAIFACEAREASGDAAPILLPDGSLLIADARLDDPAGLAARLGAELLRDAQLVAAAWQRWGAEAIEHLLGDVALAHWDPAGRTLTLARDSIGVRSLYYVDLGATLIFASSLQILLAHPDVPRDLDELALADLLTSGGNDRDRTLYRAIRRVPPGARMQFRGDRRSTVDWWSLDRIAPVRFARDDDYVEAGRALLDQAVATRLPPGNGKLAAMLSGGFDSAGVVATAARLRGELPVLAYTRVAGAPHPYAGLDERSHAASVAALYPNVDWRVIDDAPDARPGPPADWDAVERGHPQLASFNLGWYDPVHAAAEAAGADVLLVGNSGNITLSYSGQPLLAELAAAGRWRSLFREIRQLARQDGTSLARAARTYLPAVAEPRRLRRWRLSRRQGGRSPWLEYSLASPDFLDSVGFDARVERAGIELPFQPRGTGRDARYRLLMRQGARDTDDYFRRRRRFTKLDPYQDRRLVEFALGIPEEQYLKDGVRRSLARRVLADRLPAPLLAENRRGRQSPEWHAIVTLHRDRLAAMVDALATSPLASRVLDVPRIRAQFDSWPADAETARRDERRYGSTLYRAIVLGGFLSRWEAPR